MKVPKFSTKFRPENIFKYRSYFTKSGEIKGLEFTQFVDCGVNDNDGKLLGGPPVVELSGIIQGPWKVENVKYSRYLFTKILHVKDPERFYYV